METPPFSLTIGSNVINLHRFDRSWSYPRGGRMTAGNFASHVLAVENNIVNAANDAQRLHDLQHPERQVADYIARNHVGGIASALKSHRKSIFDKSTALDTVWQSGIETKDAISDVTEAVYLQILAGKKSPEIVEMISTGNNRTRRAIILRNLDLFGLEAGRAELERSAWLANVTKNFTGSTASVPSLSDPLGRRAASVNSEARRLAETELEKYEDARAEVDDHVAWLQSSINFTAALADVSPDTIWSQVAA